MVIPNTSESVDEVISPRFFFYLHSKGIGLFKQFNNNKTLKKKKIKKYWMMLAIALTGLCTVSCGGSDDDDENSGENTITEIDPEGTILVSLEGDARFTLSGTNITIARDGLNFYFPYAEVSSVGEVKGLSYITTIPSSGWTDQVAAIPGYGYVVRSGNLYVRIYMIDYVKDTKGSIDGFFIKYQVWHPNNN